MMAGVAVVVIVFTFLRSFYPTTTVRVLLQYFVARIGKHPVQVLWAQTETNAKYAHIFFK